MKRIFTLTVFICTYLIQIFSQVNSHIKTDTAYGNAMVGVDARPFSVMNKDFEIALNTIINEKNLLVSEYSGKYRDFAYRFLPETDGNQSDDNNPNMTPIRIIPKNILQVPETGSPLIIKKP